MKTPENNRSDSSIRRPISRKQIGELLNLLKSQDATERARALSQMEELGAAIVPTLIQATRSMNPFIREGAVALLARMKVSRGWDHVLRSLEDDDKQVRLAAVKACAVYFRTEAIPSLIERLIDSSPEVRNQATIVLTDFGEKSLPSLIQCFQNQNIELCAAAIEVISQIGTPAVSYLIEETSSDNYAVREAAVETLGKIQAQEAVPYLLHLLKDADEGVIEAAIEALGEIGDRCAVSHILPFMKVKNSALRREAVHALGKLGDKTITPYLIDSLKIEENDFTRSVIVQSLGQVADPRARGDLQNCSEQDPDPETRQAAKEALDNL